MYQLSLDLRFPLTEQIPLPLDYSGCDTRYRNYANLCIGTSGMYAVLDSNGIGTWTTTIDLCSSIKSERIEADVVVIKRPIMSIIESLKNLRKKK